LATRTARAVIRHGNFTTYGDYHNDDFLDDDVPTYIAEWVKVYLNRSPFGQVWVDWDFEHDDWGEGAEFPLDLIVGFNWYGTSDCW
jgi:hypothetical protein